ncbi:MAG: DHH family phosphoesterase [Methylovulum sp.]|nr:DHH family phosphoesterase [Methylovulum sp.]MDD2725646.1 DHH family phosphoesterase [Methylovulum sp.]
MTPYRTLIIYHADCLDGLGAAWAAFCHFGQEARYIAARYGGRFPRFQAGTDIYILDFSYPPEVLLTAASTAACVTLIDHHATAMGQCRTFFDTRPCPDNLRLCFDMARSGCVLSWRQFFPGREVPPILLHIEDRDLWQFTLPGTQAITSALYEQMPMSLTDFGSQQLPELLRVGGIQTAQLAKMVQRLVKSSHRVDLAGVKGLAVNAPSFFSSDLGHVLAKKSGTFGMTYQYDGGKRQWVFGLRSIGAFNVGAVAEGFGGGGHLNAAGFTLPDNPFLPWPG